MTSVTCVALMLLKEFFTISLTSRRQIFLSLRLQFRFYLLFKFKRLQNFTVGEKVKMANLWIFLFNICSSELKGLYKPCISYNGLIDRWFLLFYLQESYCICICDHPSFRSGSCCSIFCVLFYDLCTVVFLFMVFSNCIVSLFSTDEFGYPFGILRLCLITEVRTLKSNTFTCWEGG